MEPPRDMHRHAGDERLPAQVELPDGVLESVLETAEECSIAALQPDQEVRIGQVVPVGKDRIAPGIVGPPDPIGAAVGQCAAPCRLGSPFS